MSRPHNGRALRIWHANTTQQVGDDDVPVNLSATAYSDKVYGPLRGGRFSVQLIWTAGVTGAFSLQYTLKSDPNEATDTDWVTDAAATVIGTSLTVAGGAGNAIIFGGNVLPEWFRVKYTHTSGGPSTILALARLEGDH
jgi:hypothetical protein